MKLLFLGVSSAFSVGYSRFQSNILIESESGQTLLLDCGGDARHSLFAQGYTHRDIDAVYISHLHSDHTGGLEWLGFSKKFIDGLKATLYISKDQTSRLWNNVLAGGMSSLEEEEANLSSFYDVIAIDSKFIWEGYTFQLIKTTHSFTNRKVLPSYGLFITGATKKLFISTDTRFTPTDLQTVYQDADVIFHDCETCQFESGQHAHYKNLKTLDDTIKKKIWLYDYNDGVLPDATKDGFLGFVVQGQCFYF